MVENIQYILYKTYSILGINSYNFRVISLSIIILTFIIFIMLIGYIYIKHFFVMVDYLVSRKPKNPINFSYIKLILNLRRRGVKPLKIAQTIMFDTNQKYSEEQILQIVFALEGLLEIYKAGQLNSALGEKKRSFEDAIKKFINGDSSLILDVLNQSIENNTYMLQLLSEKDKPELKRHISNLYLIAGNIAYLSNANLAKILFSNAISEDINNFSAISALANIYYNEYKSFKKARKLYQSIISKADADFDYVLIANAKEKLLKYNHSSIDPREYEDFYNSIGINLEITEEEESVLKIIKKDENIDDIISMWIRT